MEINNLKAQKNDSKCKLAQMGLREITRKF